MQQARGSFRLFVLDHELDVVQASRFIAMMSVMYADALIACSTPSTTRVLAAGHRDPCRQHRRQRADVGDPAWSPLLPATPNHPEYPSAHSCITPSGGRVIAAFLRTPVDRLHGPQPDRPRRSPFATVGTPERGRQRPHLGRDPLPLGGQGRHRHRPAGRRQRARQPLPPYAGVVAHDYGSRRCDSSRHGWKSPGTELSGLALSRRGGSGGLLAIGDQQDGMAHATLTEEPLDWSVVDLERFGLDRAQVEGIATTADGRILLLCETPPLVHVLHSTPSRRRRSCSCPPTTGARRRLRRVVVVRRRAGPAP